MFEKYGGFTRVPNSLLDAICSSAPSRNETKVLMAVIRKTYGYDKLEDWISGGQLEKITKMNKRNALSALRRLVEKNIIIRTGKRLSVNLQLEDWSNSHTCKDEKTTRPEDGKTPEQLFDEFFEDSEAFKKKYGVKLYNFHNRLI